MMLINPGTGNLPSGTRADSEQNIRAFIAELQKHHAHPITHEFKGECDKGRDNYLITDGKQTHEISMPAIPLEEVRPSNGNFFGFPRLYVDGSSWYWGYALSMCFDK